jgi:hypothetical protein
VPGTGRCGRTERDCRERTHGYPSWEERWSRSCRAVPQPVFKRLGGYDDVNDAGQHDPLAGHLTMCCASASAVRLEAGTGNGAWWPRWNGILGKWFPVSALIRFTAQASPTCLGQSSGWLLSTISGAIYQGRQERDQMDAVGAPETSRQRGAVQTSRTNLQFRQIHADTCFAIGGRTLVAHDAAGEVAENPMRKWSAMAARSRPNWPRLPCHEAYSRNFWN